jgi:SAM-dependent MidA family methyltransferase
LAGRFADWLEAIPGKKVQLVEAGAHGVQLALDILSELEAKNASCWPRLEYWLIEPSRRRRTWQAQRLARFADRIRWMDAPEDFGDGVVHGIIFSNELLDAFPVTRLRWSARTGTWGEMGVTAGPAGFEWVTLPTMAERVKELLNEAGLIVPPDLARVLTDGFILDLAEGAGHWWRSAAAALKQGVLMTVDYGLVAEGFLSPSRAGGTLRAYRQHRVATDVLADPGEQDLTSHVNFSQLARAGESVGLTSEPLVDQSQFLLAIARDLWERLRVDRLAPAEVRQLQTLTHPEHLGSRFRVLVQRRER